MPLFRDPHETLVVSGNVLPDMALEGSLFFKTSPTIGWYFWGRDNKWTYWGLSAEGIQGPLVSPGFMYPQDGEDGQPGPPGLAGSGLLSVSGAANLVFATPDGAPGAAELRQIMPGDLYSSPTASLSGGSTNETGSTVANVALSWTCNKTMTTRTLSAPVPSPDRDRGPGQNGTYTHTGANLTSNTTYTITVGDGTNTGTSSTTVSFVNRRYYGVSANAGPLTNGEVLALSKEFATSRSNTHAYDCTGGNYIWICFPAALGTPTFVVGGLETTFDLTTQDVTNDSGALASFSCYRSHELQTGSSITVVVS